MATRIFFFEKCPPAFLREFVKEKNLSSLSNFIWPLGALFARLSCEQPPENLFSLER